MLVAFQDYSKAFLIENKAQLDLTSNESSRNQKSAFMGCNQIFLNVEFRANQKVEFSNIGATEMHCEENKNLEKEFSKDLLKMKSYKVEGHFLTLYDKDGNTMKFVAADWD